MSVTIRRATPDDIPQLARLGAVTFVETFGHLYKPQDLQTFLTSSRSEARYAKMLADAKTGIWLAGAESQPPVGYAVVGRCKLPVENLESTAGELQELYVLSGHRGLELGSRLLNVAFRWLDEQGFAPVYIGVWSENEGAQRLYGRYGFMKVGEYGFPVGDHVDREYILKRG
ncbi:MAG TPA: N-acetyltransferase [Povalibacter sp.]|uniref:N-acetyltransferase n=1 Tax=Povalibacter sp. TaxID=1962978 RepID=UPI002C959FB6|nr:N-acetyltransferase [Povalibacter sp.]HMN47358.1 N-acetyltransferase [Povalibacter sp.]